MTQKPNMPPVGEEVTPETLKAAKAQRRARRARSAALSVSVVLCVLALNILFSFVAYNQIWQIDETVTRYTTRKGVSLYTPTEEFLDEIRNRVIPMVDEFNAERAARGEEPIAINIKFCMEEDKVAAADKMRILQYTARALEKEFPGKVKISYINIEQNPSAVQKYKATSSTNIYAHQIIFEFGTEYRVRAYDFFFLKNDETSTDHWAYNGEQKIASLLLALTRAESPVAAFITNHGEQLDKCQALRRLVSRAGYDVIDIDLSKDDIPENCRLLISYDPQTDFMGLGNDAYVGVEGEPSEIDRLDSFLDKAYSFMLFIDKDTPEMPVLEEYMEEWGITVSRGENADGESQNYTIRDQVQKLDKDGYVPFADYVTTGTGGSLTSSMQKVTSPAKVVFPNATAIQMAETYRTTFVEADDSAGTPAYSYGSYYRNGVSRSFHDVFYAGANAAAEVFGEQYEITTEQNRFKLMTLSVESRTVMETNYLSTTEPSYVAVFASTEFASDTVLNSAAYGNADVIAATLRNMGHEVEPADLEFKAFKVYSVDANAYQPNTADALATTAFMTLLPIAVCITVGVCVHIRRKFR